MTKLYTARQVKPFIGTLADIARKIGSQKLLVKKACEDKKEINGFVIEEKVVR